jgi:hypothetical protein
MLACIGKVRFSSLLSLLLLSLLPLLPVTSTQDRDS